MHVDEPLGKDVEAVDERVALGGGEHGGRGGEHDPRLEWFTPQVSGVRESAFSPTG